MKIGIVGTGMVGSAAAYAMAMRGTCNEVVLVDRNLSLASAHAQDISHAAPFGPAITVRAGGFDDLADAAIIVLAAGVNQQPGETRLALVGRNAEVFRQVVDSVMAVAPGALMVVASNPVDLMTYAVQRFSRLPAERVIGSGTILDSARFRVLLGEHLRIAPSSVHAYVLGEHGDSEVAVWSSAVAGNVPIDSFAEQTDRPISAELKQQITDAVRNAAYSIIAGKGSTYYGIGAGLARIAEAVLGDERAVLTVSAVTGDVLGVENVPLSLPRIIGAPGITAELRPDLNEMEQTELRASAQTIAQYLEKIDDIV